MAELIRVAADWLIPRSRAEWLAGFGAALLIYRAYLTFSGRLGYRPHDVAVLASTRPPTTRESTMAAYGFTRPLDGEMVNSLIRDRLTAQVGMLLVVMAAAIAVATAVLPRGPFAVTRALAPAVVGWVAAGRAATYYGRWWMRRRASRWESHTWLAWLEACIPDPLSASTNVSHDEVWLTWLAPRPPDLDRCVDERAPGSEGQPLTPELRKITQRCIADLAVRMGHRFESEKWREWVHHHRTPAKPRVRWWWRITRPPMRGGAIPAEEQDSLMRRTSDPNMATALAWAHELGPPPPLPDSLIAASRRAELVNAVNGPLVAASLLLALPPEEKARRLERLAVISKDYMPDVDDQRARVNLVLRLWAGCLAAAKTIAFETLSGPNTPEGRRDAFDSIDRTAAADPIFRAGVEAAWAFKHLLGQPVSFEGVPEGSPVRKWT